MIAIEYGDSWALVVSDNGTGSPDTYYLNAALSNGEALGAPQVIEYTLPNVTIKGGASVSLVMVSNGQAAVHDLIVPNCAPYPQSFPGYFMQVDPIDVQNTCSIGDTASDGQVDGIAIFGGTTHKDLDEIYGGSTGADLGSANNYPALNASPESPGFNGAASVSTDGSDTPEGNGLQSTTNQPVIALPRDLLRLGLMDGGNADDWVYDILVNGRDIWVAGAFSRWGNTPCPGLVRLDHLGRLAYDFNNFRAAFSEPIRHLALASDGNIVAASIFSSMYQNERSAQVHKINRDGTEDMAFTAPDQIAINDTAHPNLIIDVACLNDGKVAVLTPRTLTVLNSDGSIFSQQDSGGTDMFLALLGVPGTTSLLLSSHAWSSQNQPCLYGSANIPRGLKLLDESGSSFPIDSTWTNPAYIGLPALGAGTGAMASCMRAIAGPGNAYFIVGNGLTRYNGQDTSWNTQILGNLLRYSENLAQTSAWLPFGPLTTTGIGTVPAGVTGNAESWILDNTGGVGYQAFLQQSVVVATNTTCVFQFYLKKQVAANYPIVQMQFAGSSSGASLGGGGGAAIEAYAWLDPSGVNSPLLFNVAGAGNPGITMVTAPTDSGWWLVTMSLTNASSDTDLNVTIFPAYADTWGGASTSVSGSIQISAPEVIYNFWSSIYVPTTSSPAEPSESSSNSSRFQGLYKILFDGAADPNFNCQMTYGDDGMAIPFAIDGNGNIYCGGPITSIADSSGNIHATTPWMLYKLNSNGQFLAQYNMFDDAVLVARITPYGNLVCGGKFQFYGSFACGRFVTIDPWGNLIRDPIVLDDPVYASSSSAFPDVLSLPGLKSKLLLDLYTDPPSEYVWSNEQGTWVQAGSGGFTQLPPVEIQDSPAVPPNLWVPGESGFNGSSPLSIIMSDAIGGVTIWYTEDGSDPRITSNPARTQYPANASAGSYPEITQPTIITAYATKPGYADSVLSVQTFGQTLATPVISPASENIPFPVAVTITGPIGATIWYTTDGSNPATSGTAAIYTGPFNIGSAGASSAVVMAVAKQTGYFTSAIGQANYGDNIMPNLVFTPAGGAAVPVSVVIGLPATFTAGYSIVYTTSTTGNPPNPLLNPSVAITVPGPLTLNLAVGTAIQAYASAPGWTPSPVASAAYGLAIVNAPTITLPPAGSGIGTTFITADATGPEGQDIVYSINGGQAVTVASPAGVDLSDVAGINGQVTITAYSTFPGWANSPTATAQTAAILLSGLIDVNFTPGPENKVGRMAIFSNPFADVWNPVGSALGQLTTLQENFYADGSGTAQAPGATAPTELTFSPASGTFGIIPFVGDLAYKNFLQIASTSLAANNFDSVCYGLGLYVAVTSIGQIFTSPDGNSWMQTQSALPNLSRAVFVNVPGIAATQYTTVFTYTGLSNVTFNLPTPISGWTMTPAGPTATPTNGTITLTFVGAAKYPVYPEITFGTSSYGPNPPVYTNNSIAGYSGLFVVGTGIVLTSQDGINWRNITGNLPSNYTVKDIAATNANGTTEIQVVGSGGRQFSCSTANLGVWAETTPAANTGASLNSLAINATGFASQNQLAVGDGGTIYNVSGLVPASYDEVGFTRAALNPFNGEFCIVSKALNGITEAYTMTARSSPVVLPTGALPNGTTNLLDVCPYQFGFIAVGDQKILLGTFTGQVLGWTDITPVGGGGTSSTGGEWGSSSGDLGPMPFNYKGVTVGANNQVVVVGDEGIIYGNFNGSVWIWDWSNQMAGPPLGSTEALRGTFTNLTPGFYDLLIYGHGSLVAENSTFHAYVDGAQVADINDNLNPSTASDATFQNTNWQLDRQYVKFADLETVTGTIAFGVVPTGVTSGTYLIETVQWTEYGSGSGTGAGNLAPSSFTDVSTPIWSGLTFAGGFPPGWPTTVYWGVLEAPVGRITLSFYADAAGTQILGSATAFVPSSGQNANILSNPGSNVIGSVFLATAAGISLPVGAGQSIVFTGPFGTLLGGVAKAVSYSTTTVNPNVPVGSEIAANAIVGNLVGISPLTIPAGTSKPGGTANCQQLATRQYLVAAVNADTGFINAIQLSRRQGAGVRMGLPVILPETLDNLPFPAVIGGADLVGIFLSTADAALGIGPIADIYYEITACSYSTYETYLALGASGAGIPPDPTASTGTLYAGPFPLADNGEGFMVRAIAACIGRTTSKVAVTWYWPAWPESSSQGQ